jgi:large subunit ribosomal protein L21
MSYAIINVGGKQYRVREGERLLVDRLALEDGATFNPAVLLAGGEGAPQIAPSGVVVTAKVIAQTKGPKIRIGKYKKRTGYRRHAGHRAQLTQIEITAIGAGRAATQSKPDAQANTAARAKAEPADKQPDAEPKATAAAKPTAAAKSKAAAKPTAAAKPKPKAEPKEGTE